MNTIDFHRSFLTFRIDTEKKPPQSMSHKPPYSLNNARIQIECRCRIADKQSPQEQEFFLGANCKTEQVGVPRDIWLKPNADFVPIFSADGFLTIKTYARTEMEVDFYPSGRGKQPDRQLGENADAFDDVRIDVVEREGKLLDSAEEIVGATLANHPLTARTEIETERYRVVLDYPVKTINANERDMIYQTDTGPILLPDLDCSPDQLLERMELAFAAFNCPEWIELIVRVPTQVSADVGVYHYNHPVRFEARNEIYRYAS